jgi:hypothetical protein
MSNFIQTCPVGTELFGADEGRMEGRTDRHDKDYSSFSQFCDDSKPKRSPVLRVRVP